MFLYFATTDVLLATLFTIKNQKKSPFALINYLINYINRDFWRNACFFYADLREGTQGRIQKSGRGWGRNIEIDPPPRSQKCLNLGRGIFAYFPLLSPFFIYFSFFWIWIRIRIGHKRIRIRLTGNGVCDLIFPC